MNIVHTETVICIHFIHILTNVAHVVEPVFGRGSPLQTTDRTELPPGRKASKVEGGLLRLSGKVESTSESDRTSNGRSPHGA